MAKFTINIIADNSKALQSVSEIQRKLDDIERHPLEIKIDAVGDTEVLKMQTKLEQARASTARANAKIAESEAKVKIARQQTKTVTAQTVLEEKRAETAKKQATLATKKAAQAEKETQRAIENTNTAQKKKELQEERTRTKVQETTLAQEKAKAAAEKRAAAEEKGVHATKKQADATRSLTSSIQQYIEWYLRWTVVSGAFQSVISATREALSTMKAVDDELVTVRKVTGFTADEMKRVEEQAYKTASAYGVAANEYLESVAAFARAGYKEQSSALAELSTKTQIVGDTTAEVANQFLLSVDAAYKYQGSIESLSRVLDGANELDNKYATSIQKIAEGMGIVAPVAAQMNVSIDELAAAIGTITAVTQRSGSEAARALRALFLNIAGDTKTEIDEGVTWTTGEIEGLRDVIKQYAKDAYDAAQATGAVIDPMKAMEGLAKSMQDGLLTEQKLIEMVSDIGGKLRSSQLLAIIQNWDMYQSMLQDYAGAIGSADKEVENALDSWTRKTNQLKNAWVEFISHSVNSNEIKAGIDALTGAVKLLDSGFGKFALTIGAVTAAFAALQKISGALKISAFIKDITMLNAGLAVVPQTALGAAYAMGGLTGAVKSLTAAAISSPFVWVAAATAAFIGLKKLTEELTTSYKEQKAKLEDLKGQYDQLYGKGTEYDQLESNLENLNAIERERLAVLRAEADELHRQVVEAQKLAFNEWRKEQTDKGTTTTMSPTGSQYAFTIEYADATKQQADSARAALSNLNKEYLNGKKSAAEYKQEIQNLVLGLKSNAEAIRGGIEAGEQLTASERGLLTIYAQLLGILTGKTSSIIADTAASKENAEAANEVAEANETLQTAFQEVDNKSSLTYGTIAKLDALYPGFSKKILDANGNLTEEGQAALSTRAALYELISSMITANTTAMNFEGQIAALQNLATEAGIAASAISAVFSAANLATAGTGDWDEIANMSPDEVARYRAQTANATMLALLKKQIKDKEYAPGVGGGGGGGGGGGSSVDEELTALQAIVSLRKQELNFLKESGASEADQIAKMREIQDALHAQAEYLRSIGASDEDVLSLSTEWWKIENEILDLEEKIAEQIKKEQLEALKDIVDLRKSELDLMEEQGASYEERIRKTREIIAALDEQIAEMQRQGASQTEINRLLLERQRLENSILEIQKQQRQEQIQMIEAQIKALEDERDARIKALRDQIEALQDAKDEQDEITTLAEKELAVRKALEALENAKRERTVRQYNAAKNQWEWVADQRAVDAAEKALQDAEKALKDYRDEIDLKHKIAALEAQIDSIEAEYASLTDALRKLIEELEKAADDLTGIEEKLRKLREDIDELSDGDESLKQALLDLIDSIANMEVGDDAKSAMLDAIRNLFGNSGLDTEQKKQLVSIITTLFNDATLPAEAKATLLKNLEKLFSGSGLSADAKTKLLNMIQNMLGSAKMTATDVSNVVAKISALFSNTSLTAAAKEAILDGIEALVGQGKNYTSAVDLMTQFINTALAEAKDPKAAVDDLVKKLQDGTIDLKKGLDKLISDYQKTGDETARMLLIAQMRQNSLEWFTAGAERKAALHAENERIGKALGWHYDSATGKWYDAQGRVAYELGVTGGGGGTGGGDTGGGGDGGGDGGGGGDTGGGGSTGHSTDPKNDAERAYHDTYNSTTKTDSNGRYMAKTYMGDVVTAVQDATNFIKIGDNGDTNVIGGVEYLHGPGQTAWGRYQSDGDLVRYFDRGGLLHGMGGIKSTPLDEMVLPPGATRSLLNAEANGSFNALLRHLGIVTAAANSAAGFGGGISGSSIGQQNNGDVFYINGVEMRNITESTTLGDIVRQAKNLSLSKGS